jgi:hypothetical protein
MCSLTMHCSARLQAMKVSAPHPVSNIRAVLPDIPPHETAAEREYRTKQQQLREWHHTYWLEHNTKYEQVRGV